MSTIFVIKEFSGFYLNKQGELTNGDEPATLYKSPHRDIALNALIEFNAKNILLRADLLEVEATVKGLPIVEVTQAMPMPVVEEPLAEEPSAETEPSVELEPSVEIESSVESSQS